MNNYTKEYIREKITTEKNWTCKAILALYKLQTSSEKQDHETKEKNNAGFNGIDAKFLTSLAIYIQKNNFLTDNQLKSAQKIIGKYAGQLARIANQN